MIAFRRALYAIGSALILALSLSGCGEKDNLSPYVSVKDGHFTRGGDPIYYVGTNFWYGAILGSEGKGGDRVRLGRELDSLCALGLKNLRVLVGGDGPDGIPTRIEPTLQKEPGVYNEDIFKGLDYFLVEMGKRGMTAVLYVNNSWEWSGGYGMYLEWAGAGKAIIPSIEGYVPFMKQMASFATNEKAKELYFNHLRHVVSRVNSITGKPYSEDPAIFSWQIGNEPRCFSSDPAVQQAFVDWVWKAASIIKEIDPNHMVSTGSEGLWGCENDMSLNERLHSSPDIDYLTFHIWPYNWSWVNHTTPETDIDNAFKETGEIIRSHEELSTKLSKPLVLEEFGFPRDGMNYSLGSPTTGRDRYYRFVFSKIVDSYRKSGPFAGANFWGWGGLAVPLHENWQEGDPYTGDPAQEAQGLNSVFATDHSTLGVIKEAVGQLSVAGVLSSVPEDDWIFSDGEDRKPLKVTIQPLRKASTEVLLSLRKDTGEDVAEFRRKVSLDPGAGMQTLEFPLPLEPGFYRVYLSAPQCTPYEFNIGCAPERISSPADSREDFDAFWEAARKELDKVSMKAAMTLLPEHSSAERKTYKVSMYSLGGKKISGLLLLPTSPGKHPARIGYMGYGADPYYTDPDAEKDLVEFTLSVRDQGLDKVEGRHWVIEGLESKDTYYYRGAFMDCVRAVDFVCSLPQVDKDRIVAEGGSQGGAFTIVAAALDHRIKAIAPFVPFLSDYPDYFKIASWPGNEILPAAKRLGIPEEDLYDTLSYFDVKNFAPKVECPVLMGFGLQDDTCPPHTNFSSFNLMSSTSKTWLCFPYSGHHLERYPRWWEERNKFFAPFLN